MRSLVGKFVVGSVLSFFLLTMTSKAEDLPYFIDGYLDISAYNDAYGFWMNTVTNDLYITTTSSVLRHANGTASNNLEVVAGGPSSIASCCESDGGLATAKKFNVPVAVTGDGTGKLFIADSSSYAVHRVDLNTRTIYRLAGTGSFSSTMNGDGGPATSAKFSSPNGVSYRSATGDVFFADSFLSMSNIRKVGTDGIITSFIARDAVNGDTGDGGPATSATIAATRRMVLVDNKLYFATEMCHIRMVDFSTGLISNVAGISCSLGSTNEDVRATSAKMSDFPSIAVDTTGVIYVYENTCLIRKIANGVINSIAGVRNACTNFPTLGKPALETGLIAPPVPAGIVVDLAGNVFFGVKNPGLTPVVLALIPTADPTPAPTMEPTVSFEPTISFAPSLFPSQEPTVSGTIVPSVTPSLQPTVQPSEVPSVQPSVVPSQVPSLEPSEVPSQVPSETPSVVPSSLPTVQPTEVPSVEPSVEPSQEPSVKPSRTPSQKPTVRPSKVPTAKPSQKPTPAPSVVFAGVVVGANVTMDNVHIEEGGDRRRRLARAGSMVLMEESDNAIIKAVAEALDLSEEHVTIESEHIVSSEDNVATVLVELKILAPKEDFPTYADFQQAFGDAIAFNGLAEYLVTVAEDIGAYELYQITAVTIDALTNEGAIDTSESEDDDGVSRGEYAGIIISAVFIVLVSVLAVWWCVWSAPDVSGKTAASNTAQNNV